MVIFTFGDQLLQMIFPFFGVFCCLQSLVSCLVLGTGDGLGFIVTLTDILKFSSMKFNKAFKNWSRNLSSAEFCGSYFKKS